LEKVLEKNSKMEKHTKLVWPIITPGLPKQNAGFNINMSTRKIIWREMKGGKHIRDSVFHILPNLILPKLPSLNF